METKSGMSVLTALLFLLSCAPENLPDKRVGIRVVFLSPKANDVLRAGESYEILWKVEPSASEFGSTVTVEFSKDGGKSWEQSSRKCTE